MSDGPHKSLPLRPRWREVAKRASKDAFDRSAIQEALEPALLGDCRAELPASLTRRVLAVLEGTDLLSRLPEGQIGQLRAMRDDPSLDPLGASLIECSMMSVAQGLTGRAAFFDAAETALLERSVNNARTTEEHFRDKGTRNQDIKIRRRMSEAIETSDCFSRIARSLGGVSDVTISRRAPVHDGLDEGPPL